MTLFFMQAECGDAAHLVYHGTDKLSHHIFIDAGFERTYRHVLAQRIETVESIDLFIISHIHDDHIGGAIAYQKAIDRGEVGDKVLSWCYNSPRAVTPRTIVEGEISVATSIDQGDQLTAYLTRQKRLPEDTTTLATPLELHGLTITWLSPTPTKLKRLREKYADLSTLLEKEEGADLSFASGASGNDYHFTIEQFDLQKWTEDSNLENGSSISFLCELGKSRVLFLADAHPSDIADSIKRLGYCPENRLYVDYVKVTHHGSKGNNSDELFDLIECSHYMFSTNGINRHFLPSKETMARLLRNSKRDTKKDHFHFYFTYDNETLRGMFDVDGAEVYGRWNFELHFTPPGERWLELSSL